MDDVTDARGVTISPGDTAIYGFTVGRSVAMAEAVVLLDPETEMVSLTPSGRVRLRIIRRSYNSGEKPVVDVAPDRLVVLKPAYNNWEERAHLRLPASPLPTQSEKLADEFRRRIAQFEEEATEAPPYWGKDLASYREWCAERADEFRKKLAEVESWTEKNS